MKYLITASCGNGHQQKLLVDGMSGKEYARMLAGLLDGTSMFYIYPPVGGDSVIGKCAICGVQFRCTVEERA